VKLQTLISILTSSGPLKIYWRDREELLSQITYRHSSFQDSTETMNNPVVITDLIINMSDKIQIYQKQEIHEVEILKRANDLPSSKDDVKLIDTLKQIIENKNIEENKKDGSFFIELNKDDLYELFSLEIFRKRQLDKLI
jgi:hypothetical protein